VAYQHQPSARDAGLAKVAALTVALGLAGVAGTAGIGWAIANAAPTPKKAGTDYSKPAKPATQNKAEGKPGSNNGTQAPGAVTPPEEKPESSSGDEQTTSGGS
jgi:hypothetical protein